MAEAVDRHAANQNNGCDAENGHVVERNLTPDDHVYTLCNWGAREPTRWLRETSQERRLTSAGSQRVRRRVAGAEGTALAQEDRLEVVYEYSGPTTVRVRLRRGRGAFLDGLPEHSGRLKARYRREQQEGDSRSRQGGREGIC